MDLTVNKPRVMIASAERTKIDRKVLSWINECQILPSDAVPENQLGINQPGIGISATTTAYVSQYYITGGYKAEYNFTLIYRIRPGGIPDKSLQANEVLNSIGDWAMNNKPDIGTAINVLSVTPTSPAITYALYQDGDEDHHIEIKIEYEVI